MRMSLCFFFFFFLNRNFEKNQPDADFYSGFKSDNTLRADVYVYIYVFTFILYKRNLICDPPWEIQYICPIIHNTHATRTEITQTRV